jgi:hypothetical protein
MDRRTKILAAVFGAVLLYAMLSSLVYPQWIKPLLNIDERIAEREEQYDELKAIEDEVDRAKEDYRALAARVGSFDVTKVETELRARLNELIEKHQLQDMSTSPSRPTEDRKTGVTRMQLTVTAVGKLKSVLGFLEDMAELPQLVRVGNAAMYPASGTRKGQSRDRMHLRLPLEVMMVPEQRIVGRLDESELVRPDPFPPRHQGRDYSLIWDRKPFMEPIPLKADAGRDVSRRQGQAARLMGDASGGDGEYKCEWFPTDHIAEPTACTTTIDTSEAFEETYTVTVTDGSGEKAEDTVQVVITEGRRQKPSPDDRPQPPRAADKRWKDRKYMQLCMMLGHRVGDDRSRELMIFNNRSKQNEYYKVGDEFNGGELVFVHPRGGVVRRNDEYFLYPIGTWLDQEVGASDAAAGDYPDLKSVADRHREAVGASVAEQGTASTTPAGQGQDGGTKQEPGVGSKPAGTGVSGKPGQAAQAPDKSRPARSRPTAKPTATKDKKDPAARPKGKKKPKTQRVRRTGRPGG